MTCEGIWESNCWYMDVYCKTCSAKGEGDVLRYKPVDSSLPYNKHPHFIEERKEKAEQKRQEKLQRRSTSEFKAASSNSRKGRKVERVVAKKLGATMTLGSGAVLGDGDFYIGDHYVEHKLRINGKNALGPTKAEWEKAVGQGCTIFMVTCNGETIVTMTKETLMEIIQNN